VIHDHKIIIMNYLELNNLEFLLALSGIVVFLILLILALRYYFFSRKVNLESNNEGYKYRTKYSRVDVFKHSAIFLKVGFFISISLVLFAFSWTTMKTEGNSYDGGGLEIETLIEQIPPTIQEKKPKASIPKVILELPDEQIIEDDQAEFESMDIFENDEVISESFEPIEEKNIEAQMPLPEIDEPDDSPFRIVESMPRFPGCENQNASTKEKEECSKMELLKYLYGQLKYPAIARENGVEGMVVIRFVVTKKGGIDQVEILRDIGGGCGEAAKNVILSMKEMPEKWTPGKQRGRPVSVYYTLPVKFKLEG